MRYEPWEKWSLPYEPRWRKQVREIWEAFCYICFCFAAACFGFFTGSLFFLGELLVLKALFFGTAASLPYSTNSALALIVVPVLAGYFYGFMSFWKKFGSASPVNPEYRR